MNEPRGRRRVVSVGDRLAKTQIAARAKIDRETVSKYLAMAGAPKPDENGRYSFTEVMRWLEKNAPRLANNEEMVRLKASLMRLEEERRTIHNGVLKAKFIDRAKIVPAIAAFNAQLTENLRNEFEFALPTKYAGKKVVEIQEMNAAAIDRVLAKLKAGQAPLVPKEIGQSNMI